MKQHVKLLVVLSVMLALLFSVACGDDTGTEEVPKEAEAKTEMMEAPAMTSRLDTVRERGHVICASRNDVPGYGSIDEAGNNVGFDIDLCRAVAAAVLNDPDAFEIRLITAAERGPTVQSGEVDLLVRTVTWTTSRDAAWGNYAQTMFYDGQGFMVPKSLGVTSAYELGGAAVCVTSGTTTELNMADFFRQNNLEYNPKVYEDTDLVLEAYQSGACEVFTNDRSQLAALRTALTDPDNHVILPETISEEPLGPVVPHGDEQWFDIVKTVMSGLIYAEAYGINSGNVASMAGGDNVKAKRLLGTEGGFGQETLGLSETFMQDVISSVGNYGEIYARNLGPEGIDLPREGGRNALWANAPCTDCPKGGQIYAPPLR
jgi:general L-amino acid transport system substrate-binding protein